MRLTQITPFVPCTDLFRQIGFYRDVLGFTLSFQAENYAFLRRDAVAVRLIEVGDGIDLNHPERETSFYIDVTGIDRLYDSMAPDLAKLPAGRVRPSINPMVSASFTSRTKIARWFFSARRSDVNRAVKRGYGMAQISVVGSAE